MSRDEVAKYIIAQLCERFSLPPNYFKESDNLRQKWLFDEMSLVAWGKEINRAEWHGVYVTPLEMAGCKTIKDVIDLVYGKVKKTTK